MSNDIYVKLCERFGWFEQKVAPVEASYEILKIAYTEEEAETAANFPEGIFTIDALAKELKRDKSELLPLVETMADKGHVFVMKKETGESEYELAPWLPGVIELTISRFLDDPETLQRIMALSAKAEEQVRALTKDMDPEAVLSMLPPPMLRTLVINEDVPDNTSVETYESVIEMIEKEESFAVSRCVCRGMAEQRGEPCRHKEIPELSCMSFGALADYHVKRGFYQRITKEEMKQLVRTHHEAGSVFNMNNYTEKLQYLCGCCSCCCLELKQIQKLGNLLHRVDPSNFLSTVDEEICTGCGECEQRCPVNAISIEDGIAAVDPSLCLGCGNCVGICPVGSLSLKRIGDKKTLIGDRAVGFGASRLAANR